MTRNFVRPPPGIRAQMHQRLHRDPESFALVMTEAGKGKNYVIILDAELAAAGGAPMTADRRIESGLVVAVRQRLHSHARSEVASHFLAD